MYSDQADIDNDGMGDLCDPCPATTGNCDPNGSGVETVPPTGGTVSNKDNSVSITVPNGAVDSPTTIAITETESITANFDLGLGLKKYQIEPDGIVFFSVSGSVTPPTRVPYFSSDSWRPD